MHHLSKASTVESMVSLRLHTSASVLPITSTYPTFTQNKYCRIYGITHQPFSGVHYLPIASSVKSVVLFNASTQCGPSLNYSGYYIISGISQLLVPAPLITHLIIVSTAKSLNWVYQHLSDAHHLPTVRAVNQCYCSPVPWWCPSLAQSEYCKRSGTIAQCILLVPITQPYSKINSIIPLFNVVSITHVLLTHNYYSLCIKASAVVPIIRPFSMMNYTQVYTSVVFITCSYRVLSPHRYNILSKQHFGRAIIHLQ